MRRAGQMRMGKVAEKVVLLREECWTRKRFPPRLGTVLARVPLVAVLRIFVIRRRRTHQCIVLVLGLDRDVLPIRIGSRRSGRERRVNRVEEVRRFGLSDRRPEREEYSPKGEEALELAVLGEKDRECRERRREERKRTLSSMSRL